MVRKTAEKFFYFISKNKLTVPSAALILGVTSLGSNILGMIRSRMIASQFGASHTTDIFYASFKIPDLIFSLLVLGAVASAFIPVFVDSLSKKDKEEANRVASNFLNFLLLCTLVLSVVVFVLARKLVPFLLPGFFANGAPDAGTFETTVNATRIMIISPIIFAISGVFGAILNSHKKFLAYALAPLVYNIGIIIGIMFFVNKFGNPVYGLLAGVLLGAVLHMLIQLPSVLLTGFKYRPLLVFGKYRLPEIIKLMAPRVLSIGVGQINLLVDTVIASYFTRIGGITILTFANDIQTLPTVVFGISIATAIFPYLTEHHTNGERKEFMKAFSESARKIMYFMIPASIGIIALRAQIIRLVFGAGNFDWQSTYWTTKALAFFGIGLVAQGLIPLLIRAFYALKDTKTPLVISAITMVTNVLLSVTLPFIPNLGLGVAGVALAFSISGFVNVLLLFYYLNNKIGALDKDNRIFDSTARLLFASVIMGILAHYSLYFFNLFVDTHTVIGLGIQTLGAVAVGGLTYIILTHVMRCEETGIVFRKIV
jgi:putative peptidoglycan lipid II flippase